MLMANEGNLFPSLSSHWLDLMKSVVLNTGTAGELT